MLSMLNMIKDSIKLLDKQELCSIAIAYIYNFELFIAFFMH